MLLRELVSESFVCASFCWMYTYKYSCMCIFRDKKNKQSKLVFLEIWQIEKNSLHTCMYVCMCIFIIITWMYVSRVSIYITIMYLLVCMIVLSLFGQTLCTLKVCFCFETNTWVCLRKHECIFLKHIFECWKGVRV